MKPRDIKLNVKGKDALSTGKGIFRRTGTQLKLILSMVEVNLSDVDHRYDNPPERFRTLVDDCPINDGESGYATMISSDYGITALDDYYTQVTVNFVLKTKKPQHGPDDDFRNERSELLKSLIGIS